MPKSILIVEDNQQQLQQFTSIFAEHDYTVTTADSFRSGREKLELEDFNLLLIDVHLDVPDGKEKHAEPAGISLLRYAKKLCRHHLILMVSSDPSIEVWKQIRNLGAHYFYRKPLRNYDEFAIGIEFAQQRRERDSSVEEKSVVAERNTSAETGGLFLNQDALLLIETAGLNENLPVMILGETGTGKEEVAKLIYAKRMKRDAALPFVSVNCAEIDPALAQSILFGHRKGAFSGAEETTVGLVGKADGGILFIDEIHHLKPDCQAKLLRVLNDGRYMRLGDTVPLHAALQIIAASSKNLDEKVQSGEFLLDLRSRIMGIDIVLPPLREWLNDRKNAGAIISQFFEDKKISLTKHEKDEFVKVCRGLHWQGNFRMLYKMLDVCVAISQINGERPNPQNMPLSSLMSEPSRHEENYGSKSTLDNPGPDSARNIGGDLKQAASQILPLADMLEKYEKEIITARLQHFRRIQDAARSLGISRNTLDLKRKKYGLTS